MTTAMATDKSDPPAGALRRVAIAATFTAEPLEESLAFWFEQLRLPFKVQFAAFNQVFQELLDRTSLLSSNERGFNVVLIRLEDLGAFDRPAAVAELRGCLDELVASMKSSQAALVSPLWVGVCPPSDSMMQIEQVGQEYRRLEDHFVASLAGLSSVRVLRYQDVVARYPTTVEAIPAREAHGHIPYARGILCRAWHRDRSRTTRRGKKPRQGAGPGLRPDALERGQCGRRSVWRRDRRPTARNPGVRAAATHGRRSRLPVQQERGGGRVLRVRPAPRHVAQARARHARRA